MFFSFGKGKTNQSSFHPPKQTGIHSTVTSMRPNLAALIPDEWEAALTEECEFILDRGRQNMFPLL